MEQVPFCERNTKLWVTLLVAFGVGVLAYSLWVAWERGEFSGFNHRQRGGVAYHSGSAANASAHGAPVRGTSPLGALTPVALGGTAPRDPRVLAPAYPSQGLPVDTVTRATPQGGIQFIGGADATDLQHAFNRAADTIRPSVVSINATRGAQVRPQSSDRGVTRFIAPFDGQPDLQIGRLGFENVGSGVIVDPEGYIVTNHHVIEDATEIVVSPIGPRGEHMRAEVVAVDRMSDLALLRLAGTGRLPTATLADSSRVETGDWVLAVGNPFGLERTVTAGIVSGRRNDLIIRGVSYHNLIQTDAPINRGSSGGPLVDIWGNVIGINTAIYAPTGVFNGTGFAIPSNRVGAFVSRTLASRGGGRRVGGFAPGELPGEPTPYLGVAVLDMGHELARRIDYPHRGGVFVSGVTLDSPADDAELLRGDVITGVDGQAIADSDALRRIVRGIPRGQPVSIEIWRNGASERLDLTIPTTGTVQ